MLRNEDLELIDSFKKLIQYAMRYAKYAHDFIFDEKTDNMVAVSYLNIAAAKFAAAESLYYARFEILQRDEAEDIFHLFEVFMSELLTNVKTDHSHQWTDIEYERLNECFENSAFAFGN